MSTISDGTETEIMGYFTDGLEPCVEAFRDNFRVGEEIGAACAVYQDGKLVLDLWGGYSDHARRRPWKRHTLAPVFSVTKGIATVCILQLADKGLLDLDLPVAHYWPEFGTHGKERVSVRDTLAHRAGVPALEGHVTLKDILCPRHTAARLADQSPAFTPGHSHLYHAITIGWITGELVWRVTGHSIAQYFRDNIGDPLRLRCWIGIPKNELPNVAEMQSDGYSPEVKKLLTPGSILWRGLTLNGLLPVELVGPGTGLNDPKIQTAELAGVSGICDARSLAKFYTAILQGLDGVAPLLDRSQLLRACKPISVPKTGVIEATWGTGFLRPFENQPMLGEASFGHDGAGGSIGFANYHNGIAFGYVRNRMRQGGKRDENVYRVLDALSDWINAA